MARHPLFRVTVLAVASWAILIAPASASFHFMQIEQVIGGVCGDVTQQAIQLRMRLGGQNQLAGAARLRVWDAAGANPVVLIDFASNVANSSVGSRVLSQSAAFAAEQGPPEDFLITNVIPASYLTAGRLTFESSGGTIYWSLSWGGANYTGSTTGNTLNDADGNFGPSFAGVLPWTGAQALFFDGAAGDLSTTNAADYLITLVAATFTNNAGTGVAVLPGDCIFGDGFETNTSFVGWSEFTPHP